ncbi:antibiotic biosynthesis monooxygenase family protein [Halopseudomonas aestusnigri]|uniref:Quinol monooxygenase YgiN n=1 Tax=Halopseudomonas aestusnigri TaxID=857252 RepID=A0AAQ1JQ67_9GAMM|nr:antibiotic biosynthesis monooxygenase family protein [Halopseudomonas aestusnigri]OWL89682.1 antibiotic biosynthesis monooxygenase [Halopseudomonas aestusnigri]SEG24700.1 Quinol monooxygenase YgiN [Halopseudomonas aestusnigri]
MKYIFEVTIKPGFQPEDYADAWVRASNLIQQAPGALGTELHRSLSDPAKLIAIAHWESKAARDAMEGTPNPAVAEIIRSAAHCCEIRFVGEFDEPEWVVIPPKAG